MAISKDNLNKKVGAAPSPNQEKKVSIQTNTKKTIDKQSSTLEVSPEVLNKWSEGVKIINIITNPAQGDSKKVGTDGEGKAITRTFSKIVGYRILNDTGEEIVVPSAGLPQTVDASSSAAKKRVLIYENEKPTMVKLAPGKTADLTMYEMLVFQSMPEVNSHLGGKDDWSFTCSIRQKTANSSTTASSSIQSLSLSVSPTPGKDGKNRIMQEMPRLDVLTFEPIKKKDRDGNIVEGKKYTGMAPEFSGTKWEYYLKRANTTAVGRGGRGPGAGATKSEGYSSNNYNVLRMAGIASAFSDKVSKKA